MGANNKKTAAKQIPLLEWLCAAAGLTILLVMLALLGFDAIRTAPSRPPILEVEPVRVVASRGAYVVEIKVHNRSRNTAGAVHIEGVLKQAGEEVETSTATIDYVPGQAEQRGGLIFTSDPRRHQFEARVTGYARP